MLQTPSAQIRRVRYAAGSVLAAHVHDRASLCLVAAGDYEERIRGRRAVHIPGHALVCPAGEPHAQAFGTRGALKLIVTPCGALLDFLNAEARLDQAPAATAHAFARIAARLAAELADAPDQATSLACESLALEAGALFHRTLARSAEGPATAWLDRVRDALVARAPEACTLEELGRAAGRHPVHLARAFRRRFGVSVGEYARGLRLEEAARLLRDSTRPLTEVAAECGFSDQSHLSRAFRAAYGVSPAAYRRQWR